MNTTVNTVRQSLEAFEYMSAARALYKYLWDDFCGIYLELIKGTETNICTYILDKILIMLHPFIPHLTEELWQLLKVNIVEHKDKLSILDCTYPNSDNNTTITNDVIDFEDLIKKIRLSQSDKLVIETSKKISQHIKQLSKLTNKQIAVNDIHTLDDSLTVITL
jgi:valyl-tRNA synthetase